MPRKRKAASSQQLQQLIQAVSQLTLNPPMASSVPKPTRKRRRGKKKPNVSNEGRIVLSRKEFMMTVTLPARASTGVNTKSLSPSELPFLKGISANFEMFRWDRISLFYKPAVGATYGGLVTMGVDWDSERIPSTRQNTAALTPNRTVPAWQDSERNPLVLPKDRIKQGLGIIQIPLPLIVRTSGPEPSYLRAMEP